MGKATQTTHTASFLDWFPLKAVPETKTCGQYFSWEMILWLGSGVTRSEASQDHSPCGWKGSIISLAVILQRLHIIDFWGPSVFSLAFPSMASERFQDRYLEKPCVHLCHCKAGWRLLESVLAMAGIKGGWRGWVAVELELGTAGSERNQALNPSQFDSRSCWLHPRTLLSWRAMVDSIDLLFWGTFEGSSILMEHNLGGVLLQFSLCFPFQVAASGALVQDPFTPVLWSAVHHPCDLSLPVITSITVPVWWAWRKCGVWSPTCVVNVLLEAVWHWASCFPISECPRFICQRGGIILLNTIIYETKKD